MGTVSSWLVWAAKGTEGADLPFPPEEPRGRMQPQDGGGWAVQPPAQLWRGRPQASAARWRWCWKERTRLFFGHQRGMQFTPQNLLEGCAGTLQEGRGGDFLEGTLRGAGWAEVRLSACRQHLWGHVFFKDPWGSSSTLLWCAQGWGMRVAWCSSGWSMLGKPEVKWREGEPQQRVWKPAHFSTLFWCIQQRFQAYLKQRTNHVFTASPPHQIPGHF